MTLNNVLPQKISNSKLVTFMAIGAGVALSLMALFILPIQNPKPEWGPLWMVRPFVVITLAGATGGAFSYLIGLYLGQKKALAVTISLLVYVIGLWMSMVLGLAGTLWH